MATKKSSIDTKLIRELAELVKETDLGEIEIEEGDLSIRIAARTADYGVPVTYAAPPAPAPAPVAAAPVAAPAPAAAAETAAPEAAPASGTPITAPMVGTAYLAPSPDADPFVSVGDSVKKGQTVLIVEAMKTMNQIAAPSDGTVAAINVEDGEPVEFGQTLVTLA